MVNALINKNGLFLFIEVGTFACLGKSIYHGGHLKTTTSVNNLLTVAGILR
jgi:hypothetical protein